MSTQRELIVRDLSSVSTRRQQWAYRDLVPIGVPTILAGTGGIGKSTILAWLAAGLTRGSLPGDFAGTPVRVGFISGEDDPATTLVPRLKAAGADLKLVQDFSGVRTIDHDGNEWTGLPTIADDLTALKTQLVEWGTRVLIIDPVMSLMSGDSIKASDVRRNLDPISGLAAELGIAPILVMHFGKGQGNASDKVSGSHAFRDIARSVLLLAVDEETDQRILTVDKSNYSNRAPSLAFTIDSSSVPTDDGETTIVGLAKLLGETQLTVQDLLNRSNETIWSDISAGALELLRDSDDVLETKDIAQALDEDQNKVRTYLNRLERSGRITRVGRGKWKRNDTAVPSVTDVSSVSFNHPNDTYITSDTPIKAVSGVCPACGEPAHAVLAASGFLHPTCDTAPQSGAHAEANQ